MTKFKTLCLGSCLALFAIPSFGAPTEIEYFFSFSKSNGRTSQQVGLEMDFINQTTSLIWGDRVHPFSKIPTLVEFPRDAHVAPKQVGTPPFQVVIGNSNSFVLVFADGEVVNFTDAPTPYVAEVPELAGKHNYIIYRKVTDFSDLFFVLEDQTRGLSFAFYAGMAYKLSRSVKDAVKAGTILRPKLNAQQTEWDGLIENGKVYAQLTPVHSGNQLLDSRPMNAVEINRWTRQLDHLMGRAPPNAKLPVPSEKFPPKTDLQYFTLIKDRFSVVQAEDMLEIWDAKANDTVVAKIPLLNPEFALSLTEQQLLIFYPKEHRTDAYAIGSFDHLGDYSFCAEELRTADGLKNPKAWNPRAPKSKGQPRK